MPSASSCRAARTTSSTERLWPRWITSAPWAWISRRMMLMAASWPSNRLAAVTKRSGVASGRVSETVCEAGTLMVRIQKKPGIRDCIAPPGVAPSAGVLPVAGGADPVLGYAALLAERDAHPARAGGFAGDPPEGVASGRNPGQRVFQPGTQRRMPAVARQPGDVCLRLRGQGLPVALLRHLDQHGGLLAGRHFLQPARDGGQRAFVAHQYVMVEIRRHQE